MHLFTERLEIRDFTEEDFPLFAALMADPEVMRFSLNGPMQESLAREYFQKRIFDHYKKHGFGLCALFLKSNMAFVGIVGLISQTIDEINEVELAYRLFPSHWGHGYASEACHSILHYAFDTLKKEYIVSIIDPKNVASEKVAKRVGLELWKSTRFHEFDVNIYRMTKQAFSNKK